MAPILLLIRHAEAHHNATLNYDLPDPRLTDRGLDQCRELNQHLPKQPLIDQIELIITSPMRRTVQTTLTGLDHLIQRGINVETNSMWQGIGCTPSSHLAYAETPREFIETL